MKQVTDIFVLLNTVYAMKRFYLSLCLVIVAVTTVSASSKMMAPTDSLELIGSGTGSGG